MRLIERLLKDSLVSDAAWWIGYRRRRRLQARFHQPCWPAMIRWSYDPRFEPHTDGIEWLALVGEERWLIGERMWHGWPDAPQWAFWALDAAGVVRCAWDFNDWPAAWTRAEDARGCGAQDAGKE